MMKKSRDRAWQLAVQLASGTDEQRNAIINEMEIKSWETGMARVRLPWWVRWMFADIAGEERGTVASRINIMVQKMHETS